MLNGQCNCNESKKDDDTHTQSFARREVSNSMDFNIGIRYKGMNISILMLTFVYLALASANMDSSILTKGKI